MNLLKYLGIEVPEPAKHGNPFKVFFSIQERDEYLLKVGVISKQEYETRQPNQK